MDIAMRDPQGNVVDTRGDCADRVQTQVLIEQTQAIAAGVRFLMQRFGGANRVEVPPAILRGGRG